MVWQQVAADLPGDQQACGKLLAFFSKPSCAPPSGNTVTRALVAFCLQDEGIFIVCNGLVRVRYDVWQGTSQTYFLGTGGMFGLFSALTGGPCYLTQNSGMWHGFVA